MKRPRTQPGFHHAHSPDRVVFECDEGVVLRCSDCGAIELRFGNAVIGLYDDDLDQLRDAIANFDESPHGSTPHPMEHALLYLGHSGNGYRFSRPQVSELHRLLVGAQLMLQMKGNPGTAPSV